MRGISAAISLSPKRLDPSIAQRRQQNGNGTTTSRLEDSLEAIKHRGPDARDTWSSNDGRVALGHVRLAINDLSPDGEQPFHSEDGNAHAVVNGELYEADTIRRKMVEEFGFSFNGECDCEIVIALYQTYGTSFLRHLRGEFSLCLYDSRLNIFIAARDRYGIKPLFFTEVDGTLLVAAEAKAFAPLDWNAEWDVEGLVHRSWIHDQRTIFKGVKKIRPGCYFTCSASGHLDHQNYWEQDYPDKHDVETRTEDELVHGVRDRLLEAIRLRLRADVRVGVFLSGGIDSSVIAGMIAHLVKEEGIKYGVEKDLSSIHCYSVGFDEDSGYDESAIARRTAESLGVQFHKTLMSEQVLADNFEQATWHNEHVMPDLNYVGKFVLSDAPKAHGVKVVLTGEGADEHFAGYAPFLPDFLSEPDHSWPASNLPDDERRDQRTEALKSSGYSFAIKDKDVDSNGAKRNAPSSQLNNVSTLAAIAPRFPPIYKKWTSEFGEPDVQQIIASNVNGRVRDLITDKWHPLHTAEYIWSKGFLANAILTALGDRAEMAHSLEARPPFLDHHLTEYVNKLPPSVKIRWDPEQRRFTEKWILREASKPFITKELYERKKHMYSAPTVWPANGPMHKLFGRLITRENVEGLGFVEWEAIKGIVSKAFDGGDVASFRLAGTIAQWVVLGQKFGVPQAQPVI